MASVLEKRFDILTAKHRQLAGTLLLGHDTDVKPSSAELDALVKTKFLREYRLADAFLLAAEAGSLDATKNNNQVILRELETLAEKAQAYMHIAGEHQYEVMDFESEREHPSLASLGVDITDTEKTLADALSNVMEATLGLYETALEYYEQLLSHKNLTNPSAPADEQGLIITNVNVGLTTECQQFRSDFSYLQHLRADLSL